MLDAYIVLIGNHTKKMHRKSHNHKSEPSNGTKRKSKLQRFPNALSGNMVQDDTDLSSISQLWTGRKLSFLTTTTKNKKNAGEWKYIERKNLI